MSFLFLLFSVPILGSSPASSNNCGLSPSDVDLVLHYQTWSAHWFDRPWNFVKQDFTVLKDSASVRLYMMQAHAVFRLSHGTVSVATCPTHSNWVECLQQSRDIATSSIPDILLGKPTLPPPFLLESLCRFSVTVPQPPRRWEPSPPGDRKQEIFEALSAEFNRAAAYFGTVERMICNNFNVQDPEVWAYADIVEPSGTLSQLLIGTFVTSTNPVRVEASTMRSPGANHRPLIMKIRRDPLEVPVSRPVR